MAKSNRKTTKPTREAKASRPAEVRANAADEQAANNSTLVNRVVVIVLVLLGLFLLFNLFSSLRDGQSGDEASDKDGTSQTENAEKTDSETDKTADDQTKTAQSSDGTTVDETDAAYNYVVGEGESYTTIARRAIASTAGDLTPAERVAAETKLTTDAGAQWLEVGQNLMLSKDAVTSAVAYAKSLSVEEKAAWQPYADLVVWDSIVK